MLADERSPSKRHSPPTSTQNIPDTSNDEVSPGSALAGPGTTRQSRKLQLRRAGFRAKMVPQRNVTPQHAPTEDWMRRRSASGTFDKSSTTADAEDWDPVMGAPKSGILQEINNNSFRRRKVGRPKIEDSLTIYEDDKLRSPQAAAMESLLSVDQRCSTPDAHSLSRSASRRHHRAHIRRDSLNAETAKYIEHLESELASAQTQLSSMTSPTVLQARSLKMRALNAETRALQDEVVQWETKYHDRVQEEVEQHTRIETSLKSRIRVLESNAEDYAQKVKDLQQQLESTASSLNAVEVANAELEKRLETGSALMISPPKQDGDAAVVPPTSPHRHARQRSMLPRFPTTGSLGNLVLPANPQNGNGNSPTTPQSSTMDPTRFPIHSPVHEGSHEMSRHATERPPRPRSLVYPDGIIDENFEFAVPSTTSKINKRFSWSTPDSHSQADSSSTCSTGTGRPLRKMRRFHAGSIMPKPLLLPSTASASNLVPATAPPLENHETPPSFPFPEILPTKEDFDCFVSPVPGRRRASTCTDGLSMALRRVTSPFAASTSPDASSAFSEASLARPISPDDIPSEKTLRDFSSFGSNIGRNLFEELQRVQQDSGFDASETSSKRTDTMLTPTTAASRSLSSRSASWNVASHHDGKRRSPSRQRSMSDQTDVAGIDKSLLLAAFNDSPAFRQSGTASKMSSKQRMTGQSTADLRGSILHQPFDRARAFLSRAQRLYHQSAFVRRIQWWLLSLALGPETTRRIMTTSMREGFDGRVTSSSSPIALLTLSASSSPLGSMPTEMKAISKRRVTAQKDKSTSSETVRASSHGTSKTHGSRTATVTSMNATVREGKRRKHSTTKSVCARTTPTGCTEDELWLSTHRHSAWLWLRFSLTLAVAIGAAIKDGPGVVMGIGCSDTKMD